MHWNSLSWRIIKSNTRISRTTLFRVHVETFIVDFSPHFIEEMLTSESPVVLMSLVAGCENDW